MRTTVLKLLCASFASMAWLGVAFGAGDGDVICFGRIAFLPQAHPWTGQIHADFGALLKQLDGAAVLDPGSVRVALSDGTVLPTRFDPAEGVPDRGDVRWAVPAMPGQEDAVEFEICFAPRSQRVWTPRDPDGVGPANLLNDGGLEQLRPGGRLPVGLMAYQEFEMLDSADLAHSGRRCLKLLPFRKEKTKRWQNTVRTPVGKGVAVEPKRAYRFTYWLRVEDGSGRLVTSSQVYWYRIDGSYIRHDGMGTVTDGDTDWRCISAALKAPADAHRAVLYTYLYSPTGKAFFDDFSILPVQQAQLHAAQSRRDGRKASLLARDPRVMRFDFGKDESAVWPGFEGITPASVYGKARGLGWLPKPAGQIQGRMAPLPDDLARDFALCYHERRFAVDLPNGEYRALLLIGDSGVGQPIHPTHVDWSVAVNGKPALRYRPEPEEWYRQVMYRNIGDWWEPGVDVYDRFIVPRFEEKTVPFTVTDGKVVFELWRVPLCAMVVYPADTEKALTAELERTRKARRRSVPVRFEPPAKESPVALTPEDRARGYVVFARDHSVAVLPDSAPQHGERTAELRAFAAPGEYEPVSFSVYPLRDLGTVTVSVSDLAGAAGTSIPAAAVDVGVVRYVEISKSQTEYRYTIGPGPIQPRPRAPLRPGLTTRWWLKLSIPAQARAGVYRGTVTITSATAAPLALPLSVRVVPVRLGATPVVAGLYHFERVFWYIYWWRKCFAGRDEWLREQTFKHERDDMALLKTYGVTSLATCDDLRAQAAYRDGRLELDPDHRFLQWMDLYTEMGMGPMPWYGFSAIGTRYLADGLYGSEIEQFSPEWERAYRQIITWVQENQQHRSWPEVVIYLSDELSNHGATGAEKGRRLVQLTKDIEGIRTVASMNGRWESVMLPGLGIAMPNHAFPITDDTMKTVRDAGCDLWFYNIGNSRVVWGLYLWRTGATGRFQWFHRYTVCAPYDAFDGQSPYSVTWSTLGRPLPTPALVQIREGLDDLRYLTVLETLIRAARDSGHPAAVKVAAAARRNLDDLHASIPTDARVIIGAMDAKEAGQDAAGQLAKSRVCDRYRWLIVSHILELQSALGRGGMGNE